MVSIPSLRTLPLALGISTRRTGTGRTDRDRNALPGMLQTFHSSSDCLRAAQCGDGPVALVKQSGLDRARCGLFGVHRAQGY